MNATSLRIYTGFTGRARGMVRIADERECEIL